MLHVLSICKTIEGIKNVMVLKSYFHLNLGVSTDLMEMKNLIHIYFFCP